MMTKTSVRFRAGTHPVCRVMSGVMVLERVTSGRTNRLAIGRVLK